MALNAVPRGCGVRQRGGLYLEIDTSPGGEPIESLIIDHPVVVPHRAIGITPRGIRIVRDPDEPTRPLVIDWIGSAFYPNVLDFIEEARRFGISRRLSPSVDLAAIRAGRIAFMHARAAVEHPEEFWNHPDIGSIYCPTKNKVHESTGYRSAGGPCSGFWWDDVDHGVEVDPGGRRRIVRRMMPSFSYLGRRRPAGIDVVYQPALFMATSGARRIVYIEDHPGFGCPDHIVEKLDRSGVNWEVVTE